MKHIFALVFLLGFFITANSQCTIGHQLFPMDLNSGVSAVQFGPDGQTFTACEDGQITSISIKMNEGGMSPGLIDANSYTGNMKFWLHEGEVPAFSGPGAGDPPYQVWDIDDADPTGVQVITLDVPFEVISGNVYTFGIAKTSGNDGPDTDDSPPYVDVGTNLIGESDHTFDGGLIYFNNGGPGPSTYEIGDINFLVNIEPLPAEIPTLSQWGLIILGLGLCLFALISIRQKQLLLASQ